MGWGVAENVRWKQRLEEGEAVSYVDRDGEISDKGSSRRGFEAGVYIYAMFEE